MNKTDYAKALAKRVLDRTRGLYDPQDSADVVTLAKAVLEMQDEIRQLKADLDYYIGKRQEDMR